MTGTDLYVNKPHCAEALRPWESEATTSTLPPARVRTVCGRVSPSPTETLFPILLLESVVNFSGRDVFSNEEFDHNALFHAPRYLLFAHHSSNSQIGLNSSNPSRREGGGCGFTLSRSHRCCAVRLFYVQISPGHIWTTLYICLYLLWKVFHLLSETCLSVLNNWEAYKRNILVAAFHGHAWSVKPDSVAHAASYLMGTEWYFLAVKRTGREDDHSPMSRAKVKNIWSSTSTPLYIFEAIKGTIYFRICQH